MIAKLNNYQSIDITFLKVLLLVITLINKNAS